MLKNFVHTVTLLALVSLNVSPILAEGNAATATTDSTLVTSIKDHKIVAYYLYFMPRCQTCLNIEAYSREAIETAFVKELKQGTVEWHAYDTGVPEYDHFWRDYELETKSLIIVDIENGKQARWKNCEEVWDLVEDKEAFLSYVQREMRAYLNGDSTQPDQ